MRYKTWYDQRSARCPECGYFRPAGSTVYIDGSVSDRDACGRYGYLLGSEDEDVALDCEGFKTEMQINEEAEAERRRKKALEAKRRKAK